VSPAARPLPHVEKLDASRVGDFARLHCAANGAEWCQCVAWWTPTWQGWGERSADENAALRGDLFASGEHDGYLAYVGAEPVGWCQVGPRDRLPKLAHQFALLPDSDTWAITCFFVAPQHRRMGLASFLLEEVLADLHRHGVRRVEAFPRAAFESVEDSWTGPRDIFEREGFVEVSTVGRAVVMVKEWT
jgi:GNAT superfamily N-acetyltransferase